MNAKMNNGGLILASIFLLLAIIGCASRPTYDEYASTMQPVSSDNGRIYIYRVSTVGFAIRPTLRIDGEPVGRAIPEGFFYLDLPAGNYEISALKNTKIILSVGLEAGEEKFVRLEIKFSPGDWRFTPVLVNAEIGKEELKKTRYNGEMGAAIE